jgi:ribosomal protein S1
MIEDFLVEKNSFIVSHKKYLEHILPEKIKELDMFKEYTGQITGHKPFGCFIEFDDIFTGLLHVSKMSRQTKDKLETGKLKSGDKINFFIGEIAKDNKIILSEESPMEKLRKIEKFIIDNKYNIINSRIITKIDNGLIVSLNDEDLTGFVPVRELRKLKLNIDDYKRDDMIEVIFDYLNEDKLVFKLH